MCVATLKYESNVHFMRVIYAVSQGRSEARQERKTAFRPIRYCFRSTSIMMCDSANTVCALNWQICSREMHRKFCLRSNSI